MASTSFTPVSHKRISQVTVSGEWARHLRPWGKREFWKAERRAQREQAAQEAASKTGTVTVAGKPSVEVPPGTVNSILKQAGLKK